MLTHLSRVLALLLLLLLSLQHATASGLSSDAQSPNFLVVMTDDCDMLTLQGGSLHITVS